MRSMIQPSDATDTSSDWAIPFVFCMYQARNVLEKGQQQHLKQCRTLHSGKFARYTADVALQKVCANATCSPCMLFKARSPNC